MAEHEILHLLDFFHEHERQDRDDHVTVHDENILNSRKKQFVKRKKGLAYTLGFEYDPDSIMHYSNKAFTTNGKSLILNQINCIRK